MGARDVSASLLEPAYPHYVQARNFFTNFLTYLIGVSAVHCVGAILRIMAHTITATISSQHGRIRHSPDLLDLLSVPNIPRCLGGKSKKLPQDPRSVAFMFDHDGFDQSYSPHIATNTYKNCVPAFVYFGYIRCLPGEGTSSDDRSRSAACNIAIPTPSGF